MKVIDLNLLLYAINRNAPQHEAARAWWEDCLNGEEPIGLAWVVTLGFLRLTTRRALFESPLSPEQAFTIVDGWLSRPQVIVLRPGEEHWTVLRRLLSSAGVAGNLTTDAHLAALTIEYGGVLQTTDRDFHRFTPELALHDPLIH